MKYKKGQSGNPKGRPEGATSEKVKLWEALGSYVVNEGSTRAMQVLQGMDDEEFLHYYITMLEYFKPKQARQTLVGEGDAPLQIVISKDL